MLPPALFDRGDAVGFLEVTGRDPAAMLKGIVTGAIPGPPATEAELTAGQATYSAVLTPKGRIVSDLWMFDRSVDGSPQFELEVPAVGIESLLQHFRRFLPPRFASVKDRSEDRAMVLVGGEGAPDLLAGSVPGLGGAEARLAAMEEGEYLVASGPEAVRVTATLDHPSPAFRVVGPPGEIAGLRDRLVAAGVSAEGDEEYIARRVRAGRPEFGTDMDDQAMPAEAGIQDRAIDRTKGCYTGQEVVVRIRDRGHVNRHLRGLLLGSVPAGASASGTPLYGHPDDPERVIGELTSLADRVHAGGRGSVSPGLPGAPPAASVLALGWVRREVGPGGRVAVGSADGPEAEVRELGPDWWR